MNKLEHVFHVYTLFNLVFAVLERRLINLWVDCKQFFLHILRR